MENQKTLTSIPKYSKGEEIFNAVTHIVGGGFAIVALVLCIVYSAILGDAEKIISSVIYGITLLLMYTSSSIYHFLNRNRAKKVFRIFDHCAIFLAIAGMYTPFCLITLKGSWGYTLFAVVWIFAILGVVFNSINMHKRWVKIFSMITYLVIGWSIVSAASPLLKSMDIKGIILCLLGGIAFTIGAIFYGIGSKKKYIHSVWHLFVLLGTIFMFFSIFYYVILV